MSGYNILNLKQRFLLDITRIRNNKFIILFLIFILFLLFYFVINWFYIIFIILFYVLFLDYLFILIDILILDYLFFRIGFLKNIYLFFRKFVYYIFFSFWFIELPKIFKLMFISSFMYLWIMINFL